MFVPTVLVVGHISAERFALKVSKAMCGLNFLPTVSILRVFSDERLGFLIRAPGQALRAFSDERSAFST